VVLKAGAVIGGDGFGYLPGADGHRRIPHVGICIIEDEVEIGSNSTVDRGSVDDTVVGKGTKLDNLVHVGHNVRIGERCLLMAGVGVAGSTRLGNDVILAGHVGVTDHLTIGDGARIAAKSAVFGDVPSGAAYSGHPARAHRQFLRAQAALYRLAPIVSDIEKLVPGRGGDE
jgi:UDP-3-O-[3-hydroxymyristoyl] glucosamine N-acyltransferase